MIEIPVNSQSWTARLVLFAAVFPVLSGCASQTTIEEIKASMPQRPAELDKLESFVGEWDGTGEARLTGVGRVLEFSGTSTFGWESDGWCLVERGDYEMDEFGKMSLIGIWTYVPRGKEYHYYKCNSLGEVGEGTESYDEATRTWHLKAKWRAPTGNSSEECAMTFVNEDTIEWACTARTFFRLLKVGDSKGVMRRK